MTVQNEGEFPLFLLICSWNFTFQELHYLFEEGHLGQQSEGGVILKLFILFNTAHSCLIQQMPGLCCMMCRKSGGPCQEESKHIVTSNSISITKP